MCEQKGWLLKAHRSLSVVAALVVLFVCGERGDAQDDTFQAGLSLFEQHYRSLLQSGTLKEGNEPRLLHHDRRTKDVVVLIHGIADSPHYMLAVGQYFHRAGATVVLPLLPGHGLKEPGNAFQNQQLADAWAREVDKAVEVAALLGDRVSIGGLSTGATLSLYTIRP